MAAPTASIARSRCRRARSIRSAAGPHQHLSGRDDRAVSAMERSAAHRLARSLGASGRREFRQARSPKASTSVRALRYARAARPARDPGGDRRQAPAADGDGRACERQRLGGQDRDRPGLVSAGHRGALWRPPRTSCGATLFEQTAGMFPELVTRPICGFSCRRSAARRSTVRRRDQACRTIAPGSPAGCMTNATAPTCSARTSAPAGLT